jgi:CubicO group peptidase (beta-lactamase class C family)
LVYGCGDAEKPAATAAEADPLPQVDAAVLTGLERDVEQALAVWEVPGAAVVVVSREHVLYSRGFGYRNLHKQQPVGPRTLFRVGAALPSLTSTLIATLVDDNQLEWDTKAGELPESLAQDFGGLELAELMSRPESDAEAVAAAALPPYLRAAEAAAGRLASGDPRASFHHLVQRKIFGPAGMTMSALADQLPAMSEDFATPYHRDENGRLYAMSFPELAATRPAGVASTANDLARFLILHIRGGISQAGKRVASPANLAETRKPRRELEGSARALWPLAGKAGRGMGWVSCELTESGEAFEGWNGGAEGFSAQLGFLPRSGIGLVVLNNKDPSSGGVAFNAEVRDRLLARLFHTEYPPRSAAR